MGIEFFTGLILGVLIYSVVIYAYLVLFCKRGVFEVDLTDPNKDIFKLVLGPLGDIHRKKRLILKIETKMDSSQE